MENLNLTQQKHAFSNQKKCTIAQNKHKKTKAKFSRLLRYPAWKRRGPILISAPHKSVTYLLTYLRQLPTYLQPRDPHGAYITRAYGRRPSSRLSGSRCWWLYISTHPPQPGGTGTCIRVSVSKRINASGVNK